MSIAEKLAIIELDRNTIRAKLVELGMATSTDRLDTLAEAIENLVNRGAVSVTIKEGDTYTIPAGYHNGSGTVSGVAGGGNYNLQSKTATPTKKQQNVTPDDGYFGLSDVTVAPIPDAYQDVTSVTATAGDVLVGKIYVNAAGSVVAGTIPNNGAVSKSLDVAATSYTIPAGHHNGLGKVTITLEQKTVTPTKSQQKVTPTTGKVLSEVTVEPIPSNYIDTGDADATADNILDDKTAYVDGVKVQGTMPNNGAVSKSLDTSTKSFTIPKGYHNGAGNVSITTESKSTTPTKSQQKVTPTTGKVLSEVTVAPIPENYIDTGDADAAAENILDDKTAYVVGVKVTGTMPNNGAVSKTLDTTTKTYTVPEGYHNGTGKVSITTESKSATPTKSQQKITPSTGKVLSDVTIAPIPDEYHDVSGVDATAADVLAGKKIETESGTVTGTMPDNGTVNETLDTSTISYTIPKGNHSGTGKVSITPETKTATPTKSMQNITPTAGKVLSKVTVNPIPDAYQDVTPVTAGAADVLSGKKIVSETGEVVDGAISVNGDVSTTIDGLTTTSCTIPAGHTTGGTVSLTDDIENALDAIVGGENTGIQSELASLAESKADIAAAIENKGVDVPSGTKLDGMAALIGQIQQGSSLETSALSVSSAVGGTMYYIDENGQGRNCEPQYNLTCLKGSYFIIDHPYSTDGFFCTGCEIVHAYGPVETTVEDGANNYVVILKATEYIVSVG